MDIKVRFNPKTRLPTFNLDLVLQIKDNEAKNLIQIQGVSHGIELKLMEEVLSFGTVVKGSRLTQPLQLSNFGDVKADYRWDASAYKPHFTITPEAGYINPNSNLDLQVTFHPTVKDDDIRCNKIKCDIKGGEPLFLSLMGKCKEHDESANSLDFQAVVRKSQKKEVLIKNEEDKEWVINPTISTESAAWDGYFVGKTSFTVPAKSQGKYEVTYQPKTMTKKNDQDQMDTHRANLFFPKPNGTAEIYKLSGIATEPEPENILQETVQAKKAKFIIFPVDNWLKVP